MRLSEGYGVARVRRGRCTLATRRLIEQFAGPPGQITALDVLAPRDQDVLRLLARGLTNAEIAQQLVVERSAIKSHMASVLQELGLRDRVQAVITAYESGLIQPGQA